MAKYIDVDLLRKEIEFAKSVYGNPKRVVFGVADAFRQDGRAAMCDDILKKIDSLQQKQLEPVFEAGRKYERKQMMDEAVEGEVKDFRYLPEVNYSSAKIEFTTIPELKVGDKVRIIIVKENKK